MNILIKGPIEFAEENFFDPELIQTEYFLKYRNEYNYCRDNGFLNPYRNYCSIINYFDEIRQYNELHARSFIKRIKSDSSNWNNCEAIISEVIVYHNYIRLINEELVRSIDINQKEADVIIERMNASKYYLEVFCIMPLA